MSLLTSFNKLVYPGGWARPGFNPSHFAAGPGMRFSWVAISANPNGRTLFNATKPYTYSGATSLVTAINTENGPASYVPTSGTQQTIGLGGTLVETSTALTFAMILNFRGTFSTDPYLLGVSGGGNGMVYTPGGLPVFLGFQIGTSGTNTVSSGLSMPVTQWAFCAVSLTGTQWTAIIYNLDTGALLTASGTHTKGIAANVAGIYTVGGYGSGTNNSNCYCATAMVSTNNFLSVTQLCQWAEGSWDFWYQPIMKSMIVRNPNVASAQQQARTWIMA